MRSCRVIIDGYIRFYYCSLFKFICTRKSADDNYAAKVYKVPLNYIK